MAIKEAVIHVYTGGRTLDERRAAVSELTAAACRAYGIGPEAVTIYFFEHAADDAGYAGALVSDLRANP